jgi:dephospho-CoA kinase
MFVVGLTGGIGSGKSTVAARLQARGAAVVDTDEISRTLTGPAGDAMEAVRAAFGARFVTSEGALDRAAMRAFAFEDDTARARLEAILHPAIRSRADALLAAATGAYAIVAVPLLFETRGYMDRVARVLVVDCPEALQASRVAARSGLAAAEVRRIMDSQWPRWRRLQLADDVVWNGGDMACLEAQCERIHAFYVGNAARVAPQSPPIHGGAE